MALSNYFSILKEKNQVKTTFKILFCIRFTMILKKVSTKADITFIDTFVFYYEIVVIVRLSLMFGEYPLSEYIVYELFSYPTSLIDFKSIFDVFSAVLLNGIALLFLTKKTSSFSATST